MFSQGRLCVKAVCGNTSKLLTSVTLRTTTPEIQTICRLQCVSSTSSVSIIQVRNFNSVKFSSKLEYYSSSDIKLPKKINELNDALEDHTRPLTLLLTWLMAKDRHIKKYVKFYNDLGIDVLNVKFTPLDIMTPKSNAQLVVDQFLHFLHHYPAICPLLIHGFSVGGYLLAAAMLDMENNMEKHGMLVDRFIGQIWDSVVDVGGLPIGVARAMTDAIPVQRGIQSVLEWYLRNRYDTATIYYDRASVIFHKNFLGTPGLFLASINDPIAPPEMVFKLRDSWKELGYPVYSKCWTDTRHVTHYMGHRKEYEEQVVMFLKNVGLTLPVRSNVYPQDRKLIDFNVVKPQHATPILTLSRYNRS